MEGRAMLLDALPVAPLYLACFPQHSTATLAASPAMSFVPLALFIVHPSTSLSIAELVFWAIVGSLRSQKTKEKGQLPVRARVGGTLVLHRSQKQLL
jgi:hypothetical protein